MKLWVKSTDACNRWRAAIARLPDSLNDYPMVRGRFLLVGSFAIGLASCSVVDVRYPLSEPSCAVALEYMKKVKAETSRSLVVWVRPRLAPSRDDIAAFLKQRPQLAHSADVQNALAEADVRDASVVESCPEIRAWLSSEQILHDDIRVRSIVNSHNWPVTILSVSAPIITDNGERAKFYAEQGSGPHSGGLDAVRYRRDVHGHWVYDGKSSVSIS